MILLVEYIIFSILFSLMIFIPLYKNPIGQIMSYPVEIRRRVESLPQYKESIVKRERKHHILGAFAGTVIGIIVASLSAIYFQIYNIIFM